ncbi:MAG: hypothetical protein LBC85_11685, partial [Fibromonadaceae bacterium]|nr:hypothetical protein [Fibromonadaceae bacterium]
MKKFHVFFTLIAVLGLIIFGCSDKGNGLEEPPEECKDSPWLCGTDSSSGTEAGTSSSSEAGTSSSSEVDTSSGSEAGISSSGSLSSSSAGASAGSSSSSGTANLSSSSSQMSGANCAYMPIWCGGIAFDRVKTGSINATAEGGAEVGATEKGQDRPNCIFATEITQIGNESGGISINGTQFATGSASRCGGDNGHGWGSTTACATKFSSITRRDGGYYIYVPNWAGQDFITVGGQPVCTGSTPGSSSSQATQPSSSSTGGGGGTCVEPMFGLPPNGVTSCVRVGNSCYTCNPDRGRDCEQAWVWLVGNPSDNYWYSQVGCNESGNTGVLTCTGLASTGTTGTAITRPTVQCNGTNVSNPSFNSAPNWTTPVAGTFNVTTTANCGGSQTVPCGSIVVSTPTTNQLTCTGLAATGIAGTAITQPTVRCNNNVVSNATFTSAPVWANPVAGSFNVIANASCGGSNTTATCGTIAVSPRLTCGNPTPATVTAGTAVTPPTVSCGTTAVTSGITWAGAPTYWTNPAAGTYNNIRATATSGNCNGQTATCGTLTVNARLTCASATSTITVGQIPPKPAVACGNQTLTSGITWGPTSMNTAATAAGTITNVTATASCGGSNQTASCAGTITVTAQTPSSSSATGVSSSAGGGGTAYVIRTPGSQSSTITHYWDACKPSCSWNANAGGNPARSCNITGGNIGANDSDRSACQSGTAFTCMNQAPWSVPHSGAPGGRISFGYVAVNGETCGTCYQLDFPNNQVMVVMKSNIGDILGGAKFDLMVPGGGVGDFDALTRQIQHSGIANPQMGVRYGG